MSRRKHYAAGFSLAGVTVCGRPLAAVDTALTLRDTTCRTCNGSDRRRADNGGGQW